MNIVVISDTHNNFDILYDIVSRNRCADIFIHLGDGEREYYDVRNLFPEKAFLYVKGNNDWGNYPTTHTFSYENHKFFLTHGHCFSCSSVHSLITASAKANGCDIALFGHSHIPFYQEIDGVHLFNPGSPTRPRGLSLPSFGIIQTQKNGSLKFEHKKYEF